MPPPMQLYPHFPCRSTIPWGSISGYKVQRGVYRCRRTLAKRTAKGRGANMFGPQRAGAFQMRFNYPSHRLRVPAGRRQGYEDINTDVQYRYKGCGVPWATANTPKTRGRLSGPHPPGRGISSSSAFFNYPPATSVVNGTKGDTTNMLWPFKQPEHGPC